MSVLQRLSSHLFARNPSPRPRAQPVSHLRPQLEALENRSLPSTLTVSTTADSGAGSLRNRVAAAAPGDTIVFAPSLNGQVIKLTTGEIALTKGVTIKGPGASLLTISGNNNSRIFNVNDGTAAVINVNIRGLKLTAGKIGNDGGGAITNNERLTVSNAVVTGNNAINGGGIANAFGATLTVLNSTFKGNTTTSVGGGGILNNGTLTVQNSTFFGNTAPINGGAINIQGGGTVTLLNTTIANNTSGSLGGGISNLGTLVVFNSTISGNTGPGGAGIASGNTNVTIESTIVAQNNGNGDFSGPGYKINFSLIGNAVGLTLLPGSGHNLVNVNAKLGPLQNNGGPTLTMAPLAGSPALKKGSNPQHLATDQRGRPRSAFGKVDIGAVQVTQAPRAHTRRMGAIV